MVFLGRELAISNVQGLSLVSFRSESTIFACRFDRNRDRLL